MWRPVEFPGVLLLHAHYATQSFPRHSHEEFVIGINEGGAHSFRSRGDSHAVPPGTIALVNPGEVHTGEVLGAHGWHYRGFYPDASVLQELWREAGGRAAMPPFFPSAVRDPELAAALLAAHRALEHSPDGLERASLLVRALTALLMRHAGHAPRPAATAVPKPAVARARAFIHAHFARQISLDDLAFEARLGRFQILRAFRAELGLPPHEYLTALRVARARRMLASGASASRVAADVGFCDQSHLTRHFKRLTGVTPGQYARAASSGARSHRIV